MNNEDISFRLKSVLKTMVSDYSLKGDINGDLFKSGLLDSLNTVRLVLAIEDEFKISFKEINFEKLSCLELIEIEVKKLI
jgi:acyl carrier protein